MTMPWERAAEFWEGSARAHEMSAAQNEREASLLHELITLQPAATTTTGLRVQNARRALAAALQEHVKEQRQTAAAHQRRAALMRAQQTATPVPDKDPGAVR